MNIEQLKSQLPFNFGFQPFYRLRWRFDFDGKPTKFGGWNAARQNPHEMAAFVDKTGLVRASIEGELIGAWIVKTLFECDGHLYSSTEWNMAASIPAFLPKSDMIRPGSVIGMSMLTANEKITVFVDGQIKRRALNNYETQFKLREHSFGG